MELTIEQALQQGVSAHKEGRFEEAESLYRAILQAQPLHSDANHNLGVLAVASNNADAALPFLKTALEANPKIEQFWLSYIDALIKEKKFDNAKEILEQGKKQGVTPVNLHFIDGQINQNIGRLHEAEASYLQTIALKPEHAEAHNNLGNTLKELGRFGEAEVSLRQTIALKPEHAEAHNNLGKTLKELGRLDEAEASCRRAIALKIGFFEAHRNLASILRKLGRAEQAIESDRYAISLSQVYAEGTEPENPADNFSFKHPSSIEYPELYRAGMGTENTGGFLRAMAQMVRPKNILEIGAGYTTPFLLEALINNERVYDDGNLQASYFENYIYESKLVVIDNMSLGELSNKPGMKNIISSKYTEFVEGNFEGKAELLREKYGDFDFVWFDCGGNTEYIKFIDEYWNICSDYIFFHFTYTNGVPNGNHKIILNNVTGNPLIVDIVEPHKSKQGSITMVRKG